MGEHMKKHLKTLKKFIATLLLATILCSSIAPNTFLYSDTITTFSGQERSDTDSLPRQ